MAETSLKANYPPIKSPERRILLGGESSVLDPLASYYLSDVARQEGWVPKIVLSRGPEYPEFRKAVEEFNPDVFGMTVYTGNHMNVWELFKGLRRERPELKTIAGGPHPTYFPIDSAEHSNFVVMGEGLDALRRILNKEVDEGIVHVTKSEPFPHSDREDFYEQNPQHRDNAVKNVMTGDGCTFNCAHCYAGNKIGDVEGIDRERIGDMERAMGSKRFFPARQRPVKEVMGEIAHLQKVAPSTRMLFFEDDVFGGKIEWLEEFSKEYSARLPFHANMRFELINPDKEKGRRRIDLLKKSGCTGLSLAIESGDETVRGEVLNRKTTPQDLIFNAFEYLGEQGFKARTYQMLGLPCGATTKPTKMGIEADLETLELNVELKKRTGLPTITWASTLTPYPGTRIARYCVDKGFYDNDSDKIIGGETYRIGSVLRHPRHWVGPSLSGDNDAWMSDEEQQEYRTKLTSLMDYFPVFALIPDGHEVARDFLEKGKFEFDDVYRLMESKGVFEKIPEGELLKSKLRANANGTRLDRNGVVRYHMYDHDLLKVED